MDNLKDARWKQRFENFQKTYLLLEKYSKEEIKTELEMAGIIQFFELTFELAWKVMKDYLEEEGYQVKSPRESIKLAYNIGIIENGHIWIDALSSRNLTVHTYDVELATNLTDEIRNVYLPEFEKLRARLIGEF